jgi:hypothetical protein
VFCHYFKHLPDSWSFVVGADEAGYFLHAKTITWYKRCDEKLVEKNP